MKRISVNIHLSYEGLFKDLIAWGQVDPDEAERDLSRIVTLCETRGERSIFIDFPSCAKSLDYALSRGVLDVQKFAILGKAKNGLPAFMNSVFAKVFRTDGTLLDDPDHGAVLALRQVLLLYKKVQIPCSRDRIIDEVNAFFDMDQILRPVSESWANGEFISPVTLEDALVSNSGEDVSNPYLTSKRLVTLAQQVCDQIVRRFHYFDPNTIVGNHGPGAVADLAGKGDKYSFPTWNSALDRVFPRYVHGSANIRTFEFDQWVNLQDGEPLRTLPAVLIPVNKTQEKPRLIASEPTANQFIQGGLRKYLRRQIDAGTLQNCIAITNQSLSRDLAVKASLDSSLATVDLSNASDRLSCWSVERVFRKAPALLDALSSCRSHSIVDGEFTQRTTLLRKYAPQGNATVFPLQSIVYACLAIASVVWSTPKLQSSSDAELWASVKEASKQVRVYGDDIILPVSALPALSSLLELCQLKVNGGKSHFCGIFAESCGMDAFKGTDVTPVYLASVEDEVKPGDVQSAIDISNVCYRAGLMNLGNRVCETIPQQLLSQLVASRSPGPSTLLFTYSSGYSAKRTRYNRSLYREEYRTLVPSFKENRVQRDGWESLLQYFTEAPTGDCMGVVPKWSSGWSRRGRTRLVRRWEPVLLVTNQETKG